METDWFACFIIYVEFKPEEITEIMKDFDEPGFLAPTRLQLGKTKYVVIQGKGGTIICGKVCLCCSSPSSYTNRLLITLFEFILE